MSLKVEHIYKSFGSNEILHDVSLEVVTGKILSLTGESGCGKSTLLRIIAGLESPDAGNVYFNDEDITQWKPEQRRFGFVFQNLSLFPHLTVKANIFFAIKKKERTTEKLNELLSITGLIGLEGRYPHELSGGQQQRVALARALSINPKLLILDEPFSSLDELLKAKIRSEMFELLVSLNITTILVSHQPEDAFLIADNLVVMKDGKIQQKGSPVEVYKHPSSPYVSDFFGASVIVNGTSDQNSVTTAFGDLDLVSKKSGQLKLFIRPENIIIASKGNGNLSGQVVKKEFKGPHDVISIRSKTTDELISLETERCSIEVGETIYLDVPVKEIQIFD